MNFRDFFLERNFFFAFWTIRTNDKIRRDYKKSAERQRPEDYYQCSLDLDTPNAIVKAVWFMCYYCRGVKYFRLKEVRRPPPNAVPRYTSLKTN
jgi:hypothetical protein